MGVILDGHGNVIDPNENANKPLSLSNDNGSKSASIKNKNN